MSIYEANKEKIGPNPFILKPGTLLIIPGYIEKSSTGIRIGDEIYWSGYLYRDSFGNGKTKNCFPRTIGTIDFFNKNPYPVHIKGRGWVSITQVKKAKNTAPG